MAQGKTRRLGMKPNQRDEKNFSLSVKVACFPPLKGSFPFLKIWLFVPELC